MFSESIAIHVDNISKRYEIYDRPRDRLKQFIFPRLKRLAGKHIGQYFREFWALKNISFAVEKGKAVGIIGRNGSGKSTLLQIICGTLSPTIGEVRTNGRIAALLELGSGFNSEFTGRENVYMNAAILGLSKEEIDARFDDIAAFADIGEFIEQPVKSYSSGMVVRLAFAVIAHVDADILVVDEALAVGDAVFTQKCMRFIRNFKKNGTLLFVSHDMGSVLNLCEEAVWLHNGVIRERGDSKEIAEHYLHYTLQAVYGQEVELQSLERDADGDKRQAGKQSVSEIPALDYASEIRVHDNLDHSEGWRTGAGEILGVHLESLDAGQSEVFKGGDRVRVVIRAIAHQELERPILGFLVRDRLGQDLFGENTLPFTDLNPSPIAAGEMFEGAFIFRLPMLPNGHFSLVATLADGDLYNNVQHHWLHEALTINVASSRVRWGLVGVPIESVDFRKRA